MFLSQANFWEAESEANLFLENDGYFEKDQPHNKYFKKTVGWLEKLKSAAGDLTKVEAEKMSDHEWAEISRVIDRDVDRTFVSEKYRDILRNVLRELAQEFGNYHQGMSYICSLLLLFQDEATVKEIATIINHNYLIKHWRAQAIGLSTDAYVFQALVKKTTPSVMEKIDSLYIMPNTYCQKWWCGLFVHVMSLETVVQFLDTFFEQGMEYGYKVGLALLQHFQNEIESAKEQAQVYEYLRLEGDYRKESSAILERASKLEFTIAEVAVVPVPEGTSALDHVRAEMYDKHVRPAMEAAARAAEEADSSDDISSWDSDDSGEGEECQLCDMGSMPDWYCVEKKALACENCAEELKSFTLIERSELPDELPDDTDELAELVAQLSL